MWVSTQLQSIVGYNHHRLILGMPSADRPSDEDYSALSASPVL
jgi:hypothetical protein